MDIIRIIQNICVELGYKFHYGNKSHINLIDQNGNTLPDKTHLLLFPVKRGIKNYDSNSRNYSGSFLFVRPDDFAQDYYNNTDSSETKDKFTTKIEPLITELNSFENRLSYCEGFDINQFEATEIVDTLDANMTGLWVTFNVVYYE